MINQLFEIAKTVYTASLRKNLITASLLIIFPLLLGAWIFEVSNPGFQTGFVIDAGSGIMSFLAIIILGILSFEQLYWAVEQPTPWFYFSRLKSRSIFLIGKFIGISSVLGIILIVFALLLSLLVYITTDSFVLTSFKIAFMTWIEYSLFLSVVVLFSTFLSKLMSVGMIITVFFISHSLNHINNITSQGISAIISTFLPNITIFKFALENEQIIYLFLALAYFVFMSGFYLSIASYILRQKNL